jgi:glycosyltransferase involved in cell wall biosynthesis
MRLHVISLPHTEVMQAYNQCAYTAKVRKFSTMMTDLGHEVMLYSSGRNEARCTEHVRVFSRATQAKQFQDEAWWHQKNWPAVNWDANVPYWSKFNHKVNELLLQRILPGDFVCLITGYPHMELVAKLPDFVSVVEFGIGYEGILSNTFHVFESNAWMHALMGKQGPSSVDGRFYDTVIPNYFDPGEFPAKTQTGDYFLFMSRMIPRKGYEIAIETTKRIGAKLIVAGTQGDTPQYDHVEYAGYVGPEVRGELMSNAIALFCPTLYLEPFGGVVCESLMCGTPVLTTDFGAFTETVRQGVDGFRCHTVGEFEQAALALTHTRNWSDIRISAQARWSMDVVAHQYETYFERLTGLRTRGGFYEHYQQ